MKNSDTGYQLIVFDWDGTLMDSEARIVACVKKAAADNDLEVLEAPEIREIIGLGLAEAMHRLYPAVNADILAGLIDRYRFHFLGDKMVQSRLFDGVKEMISDLEKQDYLLAVATGKSRRGLEHEFATTGLGKHFVTSRCADEAFSKPNPQMLLDILDYVGMEPSDTLVIGDTEYDMQMATNAGTDCLGVSYGVHSEARLLETGAKDCLHDIIDLPNWLERG